MKQNFNVLLHMRNTWQAQKRMCLFFMYDNVIWCLYEVDFSCNFYLDKHCTGNTVSWDVTFVINIYKFALETFPSMEVHIIKGHILSCALYIL